MKYLNAQRHSDLRSLPLGLGQELLPLDALQEHGEDEVAGDGLRVHDCHHATAAIDGGSL